MDLDDGAVYRHCLDLDAHHLLPLELLEDLVQHPVLRPAIHPSVNRVPIAEPSRQPAPLATVLRHIHDSVEHLPVRKADIATLHREVPCYALILGFR